MENVPFTPSEISEQCRSHLQDCSDDDLANFVVLEDKNGRDTDFAVKIARDFYRDSIRYDLAMMQFLKQSTISKKYTIPTGYGIVEDGRNNYLVMENLRGPTIWEVMDNGAQVLSEDDADDIAGALLALRENRSLCDTLLKSNALTPLTHWYPEGQIFGFDNDGGRLVRDRDDFHRFMTARFNAAEVDPEIVPVTTTVLAHGEPSPHNLKRCLDGTIGIMDLRTTFLAPAWWDYYAVHICEEGPKYSEPLKRAMTTHGMGVGDDVLRELDAKFLKWFWYFGGGFARAERKGPMKQ
ncbi:hypothetical protein JOM56_010272 [Amanita muscaria]